MWQKREGHPAQDGVDAKRAKKLRRFFARRFCSITVFPIINPGLTADAFFTALTDLEKRVQQLAPPTMRSWEGKHFLLTKEPRDEVDLLLDKLKWSDDHRVSLDRQAALYSELNKA